MRSGGLAVGWDGVGHGWGCAAGPMSVALQCREREGGLTDEPKHPFMHQKHPKLQWLLWGLEGCWGVGGGARSGSRGSAAEPEKPRCYQCDRCYIVVENYV